MKKSLLLSLMVLVSFSLLAEEKQDAIVSEKVKITFAKLYPKAKDVQWGANGEVIYGAFTQKEKYIGAMFKADTLFGTMNQMEIAALPKPVKKHLDKYYRKYSITRTGKMHFASNRDKNNICYFTDITNGVITKRVMCLPNGDEFGGTALLESKKK
jgi:hypothetical protein